MQNYNCKNCGAELYWDTKALCLKCKYCDSTYQVTDFEDATENVETKEPEHIESEYATSEIKEGMVVYECKNCGGEVVALETTMATICPYCSEAISITSKSVGEFRPSVCIPFSIDKKQAMEIYKKYVHKSFLTPKKFKEQNTVEKIQGLFTPFHLHSMKDTSYHQLTGETTSASRSGYDRVITHRVYDMDVQAVGSFTRIPIDGAKRVDDKLMEAIEPFDYKDIKEYNPAYMAGFVAEQTDDDEEVISNRAELRAKQSMTEKAKSQFSEILSKRVINEQHTIADKSTEYAMLPIWLLNVKHGDKKYTFAVNGQTGKVTGVLPLNVGKLLLICTGIFAVADILGGLLL